MADITPHPHVLDSYANQNLTWSTAIAELIDNAFDAHANRIDIKCNNRILSVTDDGKGVKDILAIATLGSHQPYGIDGIGCYGVGAKDAALWAGSRVVVTTVYDHKRTVLVIDWKEVVISPTGGWSIPDPVTTPAGTDDPSGTVIEIALRPERKRGPGADAWQQLQWTFTPALKTGRQITYPEGRRDRKAMAPLQLPALQSSVRAAFEVDGKQVEIDIGIIPDGSKMPYKGPFWVQHKHRIITASSIGADRYNTSRIGGTITLGRGWRYSKNKDDFADYGEELKDAIFTRIHRLLEEAATLCESVESAAFDKAISDMLNAQLQGKRREKRSPGEGEGTVHPTGRRGPRTKATATTDNPGSVVTPVGRKTGFTYETEFLDDESEFGRFDYSGSRVYLNGNHPFVKLAKETDNRLAILSACWILIADFAATHETGRKGGGELRGLLSFEYTSFKSAFAHYSFIHKYDQEATQNDKSNVGG